jgi:hypothetical protein
MHKKLRKKFHTFGGIFLFAVLGIIGGIVLGLIFGLAIAWITLQIGGEFPDPNILNLGAFFGMGLGAVIGGIWGAIIGYKD